MHGSNERIINLVIVQIFVYIQRESKIDNMNLWNKF